MTTTGFVYDITCPNCGKNFSVNADEYKSITEQLTAQIEAHIRQEAKAEQATAVKVAVDAAVASANIRYSALEKKIAEEKATKEIELADLKHLLDAAEQEKKAAIQTALADKESETVRLTAEISYLKETAEMNRQAAEEQAKNQIRDIEARHQQETAQAAAAASKIVAEKDRMITVLQEQAKSADAAKQLAVKQAEDTLKDELNGKKSEIVLLQAQLQAQEKEAQSQLDSVKNDYEAILRHKEDELQQAKDHKSRLSTKALGESLEQYCLDEFNKIRAAAFPNAYFEKDNDASTGSKGDFIFRDKVDGVEVLSIMFDMKTEADQTATKQKNEHFYSKLNKDRNEKHCEYAVLVSTLEPESDYFNAGIQDVSHRYPKMFVVRPNQFIAIISLLRNAALNAAEYQKELALIKSQQLDLSHFEDNMNAFKDAFGRNYRLASEKLKAAVDGIDKNIASLLKIKENLLSSDNNLRLANDKADKLSIKQLTKGAPSVAAMIEEAKVADRSEQEISDEASYNVSIKDQHD